MIKRVRSRIKAAEISFLRKVRGLSLLKKVKSTDVCQSLNIKPLLLSIEKLQLNKQQNNKWALFRVAKGLEGDPKLNGGIILKTWPGHILKFHQRNCRLLQEIGMLEDFNSSCCFRNPERTSGQSE